eukprot:1370906-Rhodomonas_salina.2
MSETPSSSNTRHWCWNPDELMSGPQVSQEESQDQTRNFRIGSRKKGGSFGSDHGSAVVLVQSVNAVSSGQRYHAASSEKRRLNTVEELTCMSLKLDAVTVLSRRSAMRCRSERSFRTYTTPGSARNVHGQNRTPQIESGGLLPP